MANVVFISTNYLILPYHYSLFDGVEADELELDLYKEGKDVVMVNLNVSQSVKLPDSDIRL
jgi:hypothetical protein